ncbi:hypothetical protein POM88_011151 [Heracleum sosnowskyi]|uniref:Uncharacterized protein n=1 Tax=Heracleum sosnowskyi TaxID=360622 RepID=A0AAD8IXV0_9APIA|nr:hypothetical protein POM88_011151 [Heracleum sosnowskyi]
MGTYGHDCKMVVGVLVLCLVVMGSSVNEVKDAGSGEVKSTQFKPTHSTPTQSTSTKSKPAHSTPTKSKPTHSTPTKSKHTHSTPTKSKPTHSTPTKSKPTHSTPTKSMPTHSMPTESTGPPSNPTCFEPCSQKCMEGGYRSSAACGEACGAQCGTLPLIPGRKALTKAGIKGDDQAVVLVLRSVHHGLAGQGFCAWFDTKSAYLIIGRRGMIIKGWAPQVLILDHPSVGGFLSHCGGNSVIESVSCGVAMATWPLYAEHFYLEKMLMQVYGIGVEVGVEDWNLWVDCGKKITKRERIEKALRKLMDGEDEMVKEMRRKIKELGEVAKKAVQVGGSSHKNLMVLIEELKQIRDQKS